MMGDNANNHLENTINLTKKMMSIAQNLKK